MEQILTPYQAVKRIDGSRILVLAPHPDDEVFGCGGAILSHVKAGDALYVIVMTDGGFGVDEKDRAEYVLRRQNESREAAKLLGYGEPEFLAEHDREINYGEKLVCQVSDAIQNTGADLVYAPSVFEMHPDHRALGMATVEAVRRIGQGVRLALYEVGMPLRPNLLLDISAFVECKKLAMECFVSQLDKQRYDKHISALNSYRSYTLPTEVTAAEAYLVVAGDDLAHDPLNLYRSEHSRQQAIGLPLDSRDVPLISVIVRSMDRPELSDALDSLALQTYSNIEVVLVNARGTGHHKIDKWCGRFPVRMVGAGEPLLRSRAANMGLDAAQGEYLIFLDDDDWIEADHIQKLEATLRLHPEFKVAYTGVKCIDEKKNLLTRKFDSPFDAVQIVAGNFIPIHAVLFSRDLLALGCRMDESLDLYEDWDFWIQLSRHSSFLRVDGLSAVYRITQQTGFGVNADPVAAEHARWALYKKWLNRLGDHQITGLMQIVRDKPAKDGLISGLQQAIAERDIHIASFQQAAAERDGHIVNLQQTVTELLQVAAERDGHIASLQQAAVERDGHIANLQQAAVERDGHIANLQQAAVERDGHIANLQQIVAERDGQIAALYGSTSWRLTGSVRFIGHQLLRVKVVLKALPYALSICGGYHGLIKHLWNAYKKEGINGIKRRVLFSAMPGAAHSTIAHSEFSDYGEWIRRYDTLTDQDREKIKIRINQLNKAPLISVVMPVYNPPLKMLEDAIRSVQSQLYQNWELCIADDASTDAGAHKLLRRYADNDSRIKVVFREKNGHISAASNSALEMVCGEYVALLDNDDLLREQALFWVADALATNPDAGLIYSDEDKIDQAGRRYDPYFKSDWNPDLFLSHNMICHLGVYRTDLVRKLGGFREGYEGAQDYDLALRCTEQLAPQQIVHIPRVLYHWRSHPGSTAQAGSEKSYALLAGERALNDHFARTQTSAKAELLDFGMYRVRYAIPSPAPLISLIIPTHNSQDLVRLCIEGILAKTTYKNYEILIVDNNSDDPKALDYFSHLAKDNRIRILRDERPFNFSALNNAAVQQAQGEYLGLINNDIEVISPEWLDEMMGLATQPSVGAVGARLWYQNDTLQHGGVITGIGGVAGHSHKHLKKGAPGFFNRAQLIQGLSIVTAACLVVKKSIYHEVGGLDETNLKVAFNDVDFCLRVREAGYRNVWTPYAELYHHESATRGYEDTPEKKLRFQNEVLYMQKCWGDLLINDPAYSPNLTLDREDFSYAWPPRINTI